MRNIVIMVVVVIIIGAAVIFYLNQKGSFTNSTPTAADQVFQEESSGEATDKVVIDEKRTIDSDLVIGSGSSEESEKYVEYGARGLGSPTDSLKKRVYFFYADWCPTCRPLDAEIKANLDKIPADVVIIRVNYNDQYTDDSEKALARDYGITYQHTFVQVDKNGKEIAKWNGGGLDNLLSKIK